MSLRLSPRAPLAPLVLAVTACIALAAFAQPGQPAVESPAAAEPRPSRPEPRNVEAAMKGINRGLKALKPMLESPGAPEDALTRIWAIQKDALAAKSMEPVHLKGGKSPENLAAYRKGQIELIRMLLKLESEVLEAKHDDALATFAAIVAFKETAHEKFLDE